uniref:Protein-serine/threonine kinase n=1 Tax=Plectus sambesii TaxID=2011161 RepID=A0A914XPJ8_9BILA
MHLSRYLLRPLSAAIGKQLEHYSQFQPSSLSIQQYLDFGRTGNVTSSYIFLKKELLVRLANIMQEIALLPPELLRMSSCRLVNDWYKESFTDLLRYEQAPPEKQFMDRNAGYALYFSFNDELQKVLKRHSHVVETMAEGLIELKDAHGIDIASERSIQYFLDRFYINRISIRMLMNQH